MEKRQARGKQKMMRYNTPNSPMDNFRGFVRGGGMPVTLALLAINVVLFLAVFFSSGALGPRIDQYVAFTPAGFLRAPWTILTYPLAAYQFTLWLLIAWVFFWITGGSLERSWGSVRFALFFFAIAAITALSLLAGCLLVTHSAFSQPLNDLWLPLSALIVAFCMLNPQQTIVLYFFPIKAVYVAVIITIYMYIVYGSIYGPVLGLFACGGILAAFLYVRFGRSWADIGSYASRPRPARRGPDLRVYPRAARSTIDGSPTRRGLFDFAGRWRDYQERRRLAALWKNSGFSETDKERRDDEGRRRR